MLIPVGEVAVIATTHYMLICKSCAVQIAIPQVDRPHDQWQWINTIANEHMLISHD